MNQVYAPGSKPFILVGKHHAILLIFYLTSLLLLAPMSLRRGTRNYKNLSMFIERKFIVK
jgi:hypothetical protein